MFFILAQFAMLMVKSRNANEGSFGQKCGLYFVLEEKVIALKCFQTFGNSNIITYAKWECTLSFQFYEKMSFVG